MKQALIVSGVVTTMVILFALMSVKHYETMLTQRDEKIISLEVGNAMKDRTILQCNNEILKQNDRVAAKAIDGEAALAEYETKLKVARAKYDAIRKKLNAALTENPSCENELRLVNEQLYLFMGEPNEV